MTVFSSVKAATEFGFTWWGWDEESRLHIVVRDLLVRKGQKQRALAFARPESLQA